LFRSLGYMFVMFVPVLNVVAYGFMVYSAGLHAQESNWGVAWRNKYVSCQKCSSISPLFHKHCTSCGKGLRENCLGCDRAMLVVHKHCPSCGFAKPGLVKNVAKRLVRKDGKGVLSSETSFSESEDRLV